MKKTGEILCTACWQESVRKLGISCKKLIELASSMFLPFYSTFIGESYWKNSTRKGGNYQQLLLKSGTKKI